jgi:hypothetical protein
VAVLADDLIIASDTPASSLWLVRDGQGVQVELADENVAPTGVAVRDSTLYVADLGGRVWVFDLKLDN